MKNRAFFGGDEGGEMLTKIGASWFVSYAYYIHVDETEKIESEYLPLAA